MCKTNLWQKDTTSTLQVIDFAIIFIISTHTAVESKNVLVKQSTSVKLSIVLCGKCHPSVILFIQMYLLGVILFLRVFVHKVETHTPFSVISVFAFFILIVLIQITGEQLYSFSQKEAMIHLLHYNTSHRVHTVSWDQISVSQLFCCLCCFWCFCCIECPFYLGDSWTSSSLTAVAWFSKCPGTFIETVFECRPLKYSLPPTPPLLCFSAARSLAISHQTPQLLSFRNDHLLCEHPHQKHSIHHLFIYLSAPTPPITSPPPPVTLITIS